MNLEERIEMAIKPEIEVWHSEHDPSMYRQKHEMAGQLIEFQDGFEKGYMAAMTDGRSDTGTTTFGRSLGKSSKSRRMCCDEHE